MKSDEDQIEELLEQADSLEAAKSLQAAMDTLRKALRIRRHPIILTRIGSLAIHSRDFDEAINALTEAIRLAPKFGLAYFYLGLAYRDQGRLEEAHVSLQTCVKFRESSEAFTLLGVIQLDLGLTHDADVTLRTALALDDQNVEALYNLGISLRANNKEQAIKLLQRAIELDSGYGLAHRELGWLLRQTEQPKQAEYHLRRSINLDPNDGWSYIYLGNLMWATGDLLAAEQAFRKAISIWSDRSVPYWCLGHFLEYQTRPQEAEELYQRALELNPTDAQANWRFGNYLIEVGDYQDAKTYLLRALELDPADKRVSDALQKLGA